MEFIAFNMKCGLSWLFSELNCSSEICFSNFILLSIWYFT